MIVPIGQFVGHVFTADVSQSGCGLRVGDELVDLSKEEFEVWALAHSLAKNAVHHQPTRSSMLALARQIKLPNVAALTDQLLKSGLLISTSPAAGAAQAFAEEHQLMPIGVGLGNSAEELGAFQVGMPDEPRASISAGVFDVWAFGHLRAVAVGRLPVHCPSR